MNSLEVFKQVVKLAKQVSTIATLSPDVESRLMMEFAELYERYLNSIPPEHRDLIMVVMPNPNADFEYMEVRISEIPERLRRGDRELFRKLVKLFSELPEEL